MFQNRKRRRGIKGKDARFPPNHKKRDQGSSRHDDRDNNTKSFSKSKQHQSRDSSESSDNPKRQKRQHGRAPVSAQARELSAQLKQLSKEKKWNEALLAYRDASFSIRDSHHACIMVDMAARCGRIVQGEQIYKEMEKKRNAKVSVELKTALIKGYAHAGNMMQQADALFHAMCQSKSNADHPNVRTLNTLLRGCLWSAATTNTDVIVDDDNNNTSLVGGIVSADRAWQAYSLLQDAVLDVSSYEYYISLLCQALRVGDAKARIVDMKAAFGLAALDNASNDQGVTEALAMTHLALGRAHAILGERDEAVEACKQSLAFAKASRTALQSDSSFSQKRAWKESSTGDENRRAESNTIYRDHRLSEISSEAETVMEICHNSDSLKGTTTRDIARRLATRLVYLSGGGTTEFDAGQQSLSNPKKIQRGLVNSLYFSFGLSAAVSKLNIPISQESFKALTQKETNRILGSVGLQGGIVRDDGTLDLHRIFSAGIGSSKDQKKRKKKSQKVEVELGAGFGDWIVRKSIENPAINHIAVELRADRVAQIFARTAVLSYSTPVNNLCVVGGDSGAFLSRFLKPESVDTIYVNHPEPPTQTFGAETDVLQSISQGGEEPAHMLHSSVLLAAAKALKKHSKLIIVTDNKWYGRLICATLTKAKRMSPGLLEHYDLEQEDNSFHVVDSHKPGAVEESAVMFEGQPNETIGYPSQKVERGESYFDRLWRAGGGAHAEKRSRYVVVQKRGHDVEGV